MELLKFDDEVNTIIERLQKNIDSHKEMTEEYKTVKDEYNSYSKELEKIIEFENKAIEDIESERKSAIEIKNAIVKNFNKLDNKVKFYDSYYDKFKKKIDALDNLRISFDSMIAEAENDLKLLIKKTSDENIRNNNKSEEVFSRANKNNDKIYNITKENEILMLNLKNKIEILEKLQNDINEKYKNSISNIDMHIKELEVIKLKAKKGSNISIVISIISMAIAIVSIFI